MPLYEFACPRGHRTEALKRAGVVTVPCACGAPAHRLEVYAPAIGGRARPPAGQRAVDLRTYREATEQIAYEHGRAEESAQQGLPSAPLMAQAQANAAKLRSSGVTDSLDYRPEYTR